MFIYINQNDSHRLSVYKIQANISKHTKPQIPPKIEDQPKGFELNERSHRREHFV